MELVREKKHEPALHILTNFHMSQVTCTSHRIYITLYIICTSHVHLVYTTCTYRSVDHMYISCTSHCTSHGHHMDITWTSHAPIPHTCKCTLINSFLCVNSKLFLMSRYSNAQASLRVLASLEFRHFNIYNSKALQRF